MKPEQIIKRVNELTGYNLLNFSCFHDDMFIYEFDFGDELIEFTFFPKDTAMLTNQETIETLVNEADLSKYYNISIVGDINKIDISDAYTN